MRTCALILTAAAAFGVLSVEALPMTADRIAPVARAEPAIVTASPHIGPASSPTGLDRLVDLVLQRLDTADAVIAAKWVSAHGKNPVVDDPVREREVYDSMSGSGARLGLPQAWVRQVFFGQIEANKMVQRGLIARWRFDPAAAPVSSPDLTAVRPLIDRVNDEILQQLAQRRADLTGPGCATRVSASVFTVFADGRADALHQAALVRAAAALCSV